MCRRNPDGGRVGRLLGNLELDRPLCLLLHDNRAGGDPTALDHIVNMESDKITPAQLAAGGEVEEREFPGSRLSCNRIPMAPICSSLSGGFRPTSFPLFRGTARPSVFVAVSLNRSFVE
jgi:hypothetical protein